jgi:ankyrin repeat protein
MILFHLFLVNAASKGNIEIVEYLLNHHANPFIKNRLGENAYDVAATSQEIYICGLLEKAERDLWKGKRALPNCMY